MAVAPEALEAAAGAEGSAETASEPGAGFRAVSRGSGQLRRAPGALATGYRAVGTPSAAAQTVTKLLWAVALGLIALEIAAQATGQQWGLHLGQGAQGQKPQKGAYLPLYQGQPQLQTQMPGVLGGTPGLKLNPGTGGQ